MARSIVSVSVDGEVLHTIRIVISDGKLGDYMYQARNQLHASMDEQEALTRLHLAACRGIREHIKKIGGE